MVFRYTELWSSQFSPSSAATWETKDLSGYSIPANCVAEILIEYPGDDDSNELDGRGGVRNTSSGQSRYYQIQPYESIDNAITLLVNVDSSQEIEIYSQYLTGLANVPYCNFRVVGYFTGASYTEKDIELQDTDGWQTDDLFTDHSIPKGSVIDVLMGVWQDNADLEIGLREHGETGRTYLLDDGPYGQGVKWVRVFETTDATDGKVDTYSEDSSETFHYCVGYWDSNVKHTVEDQILVPSSASSWVDMDLDTWSVPTNSIGNLISRNRDQNNAEQLGVRRDGSSLSRVRSVEEGDYDGTDYYFSGYSMCVLITGSSSTIELYSSDTVYGRFSLDGYLEDANPSVSKIDNIAFSNIAKIDGIDIDDIIAINNHRIQ